MTLDVLALVVLYGCSADQSVTLRSLLACSADNCRLRIVVWDNSPVPQDLPAPLADRVQYVSTPQNLGLSVIYNRVAAENLRHEEHLLLLDQDSELPADFLEQAARAVHAHSDIDLFLPMIDAGGRQVSPLSYLLGWGRVWRHRIVGAMASQRICAINSGMLISARYLHAFAPVYDEALRFYGTDTQFILDYAARRPRLVVFQAVVQHDLSFFSADSPERARKFAAMRAALLHIYRSRPLPQLLAVRALMAAMALRYALKFREPAFLSAGNT